MPGDRDDKREEVTLDWRDYVALLIASLETIFLPLVVLMAIMAIIFVAVVV